MNESTPLSVRSYCFERKGLPPAQQISDPPLLSDGDVIWRRPVHKNGVLTFEDPAEGPPVTLEIDSRGGGPKGVLPMGKCPDRCDR